MRDEIIFYRITIILIQMIKFQVEDNFENIANTNVIEEPKEWRFFQFQCCNELMLKSGLEPRAAQMCRKCSKVMKSFEIH